MNEIRASSAADPCSILVSKIKIGRTGYPDLKA
jgi:hypothetical protein